MRKWMTTLLLSATALGLAAPAVAQENEPGERGGGFRAEQVDRPARMGEAMPDRGARSGGRQRQEPMPQQVRPAAIPPSEVSGRNWGDMAQSRPAERASPDNGSTPPARSGGEGRGWRGRWENGSSAPAPAVAVPPVLASPAPAPPAAQQTSPAPAREGWRSGGGRPDWNRGDADGTTRPGWRNNNDGSPRPGWTGRPDDNRVDRDQAWRDRANRDRAWQDRRDQAGRDNEDWRRDEAWRRDQQWRDQQARDRQWRDRQWRDGQRGSQWGRDDRRYHYDRRLTDRYRWQDQRRWNDGWRNERRYNWWDHRRSYASIYRLPPYRAPYGWNYGYRRFSVGIFLSNFLFANSYWINDPYYFRLPPAYGSLRWVRYYDDALLVDVRDGYVVDVVYDVFW